VCIFGKYAHYPANFFRRSLPIFRGKAEYAQILYATAANKLDAAEQCLCSTAMTKYAGKTMPLRPSAIAVKDDGHMTWNRVHGLPSYFLIFFDASLVWEK
jgi:hypothetical protein